MHVIDLCPRCGSDFMYHKTDFHLYRDMTDEETDETIEVVICQTCDIKDRLYKRFKKNIHDDWEQGLLNELAEDGVIYTQKVEYDWTGKKLGETSDVIPMEAFFEKIKNDYLSVKDYI